MRKLIGGVFALALLTCALMPQVAHADRIIKYPGENPASTDMNQGDRYIRETFGVFAMQLLGITASGSGAYGGLVVNPQSGMNVEVDVPSGSHGVLLQVAQADSVMPSSVTPQLGADTTNVMVPYFQNANSGGLPVPAPGSNSIYYLVEAQGQTVDTNNATRLFVDTSGNRYNANVNTVRADQIVYQIKAGTAGVSPTPPPADSGWVGIANVEVPTGATSCTASCTITQTTNTIAAAVASSCAACVLTNSNAQLATLGLDGDGAPAHGIEGGSGAIALLLTSNASGSAVFQAGINDLACNTRLWVNEIAGVTQSWVDCLGGYNVVTGGGTNQLTSSGATVTNVTDANVSGGGHQVLCSLNSGQIAPCAPGGVGTNFPSRGTVVLINSTDGCGSVTATYCATMSGSCATGNDCGKVVLTSASAVAACNQPPVLGGFSIPGQGDTTPSGTGWQTQNVANNSTSHYEIHFYNETGGSFGNTAGNALAAGFTCLI
ncbi:MAG: hypothetical protein KGL39_32915 [Patescibacteria group bacterium]|nr:hypothetical protein [Patescibacteria group bacterium]